MNKTIATALIGAVAGAGMLAPIAAHATYNSDCSGVVEAGVTVGTVGGPSNGFGSGVCVGLPDSLPRGARNPGLFGAAVEAGAGTGGSRLCTVVLGPVQVPGPGLYVIADGSDSNLIDYTAGYYGLSDNETGAQEACPPTGATGTPSNGSGTNSGGYVGVPLGLYLPVPLVVCNTNAQSFAVTGSDGCALP
jgi:hypothetical protein